MALLALAVAYAPLLLHAQAHPDHVIKVIVAYSPGHGNGNLAQKTESSNTTLYRWDANNRLIDIRVGSTAAQAQAANPSVAYAYDAAGNRIKKSVNSVASPGATSATSYLIDTNHSYAQVALESTANTPSGGSGGTGTATVNSTAYVWGVNFVSARTRWDRKANAPLLVNLVYQSTFGGFNFFEPS
jgi:hypothetical protein